MFAHRKEKVREKFDECTDVKIKSIGRFFKTERESTTGFAQTQ